MIARLKNLRDRWSASENTAARFLSDVISEFGTLARFLRDARFRSEYLTRLRQGETHLQGSTFTFRNRYPALFEQCRLSLADVAEPRLLSFGCSTGEEVQSLAQVMPKAIVVGTDLNPWCIAQARKANRNPRCIFLHRDSAEFSALRGLEAIFCLAVFQRTENQLGGSSAHAIGLSFDQFEEELSMLDRKLLPGGLLFIDHADFRFADTAVAQRYEAIASQASKRVRKRRLFGRDNTLIAEEYVAHRIFVKRAD